MVGRVSIPTEKIKKMAAEHWEVEGLTDYHWEKTIEFAKLIEKEVNRRNTIENTRMGCLMNGGHQFALSPGGGFNEMECGTPVLIKGWTGSGQCQNCDAVLAVSYREEA